MEFEPTEAMFLYDAIIAYAIRPEFADKDNIQRFFDIIAGKIEDDLKAKGYTYEGHVTYTVN